MFTSVDHVGYVVRDLERCKKFWLGFGASIFSESNPEATKVEGITGVNCPLQICMLQLPGGMKIELLQYDYSEQRSFADQSPADHPAAHIAVTVNSIDEVLPKMLEAGCKALGKPTMINGRPIMYTRGIEGELIELLEQAPR